MDWLQGYRPILEAIKMKYYIFVQKNYSDDYNHVLQSLDLIRSIYRSQRKKLVQI